MSEMQCTLYSVLCFPSHYYCVARQFCAILRTTILRQIIGATSRRGSGGLMPDRQEASGMRYRNFSERDPTAGRTHLGLPPAGRVAISAVENAAEQHIRQRSNATRGECQRGDERTSKCFLGGSTRPRDNSPNAKTTSHYVNARTPPSPSQSNGQVATKKRGGKGGRKRKGNLTF